MDADDVYWNKRPFDEWRARLDLIASASYADHDQELESGGSVFLLRGQLLATSRFLARRWGWPRPRVQRFMRRLIREETLVLVRSEGQAGTVFSVVNFEHYQTPNGGLKRGRTRSTQSIHQSIHPSEPLPPLKTNDLDGDPIHPIDPPSDPPSEPKRKKGSIERRDKEGGAAVLVPIPSMLRSPDFEEAWERRLLQWPDLDHMAHIQTLGMLQNLCEARGLAYATMALQRAVAGKHRSVVFPEDHSREARPFSDGDSESTWSLRRELRELDEKAEMLIDLPERARRRRRQLREELDRRDRAREE